MARLKLALAQIAPTLGDLERNCKIHLDCIARAQRERVDLLVFPELSLTGYLLRDDAATVALPANDPRYLEQIRQSSRGLDVVVGFVEEDERHRLYIASVYLSQGEFLHVHRKVYLPTYGIYEDGRFFTPGDAFQAFNTAFGRMGLLICEDAWHLSGAYLEWMDGADILLIVNAMPGNGLDEIEGLLLPAFVRAYAQQLTCVVAYCNRAGTEDGIAFAGGSAILSPSSQLLAQGPYFEEAWVTAEVDLDEIGRVRQQLPLLRDERLDLTLRELMRIYGVGR